jgi:hypothetical protein
MSKIQAISGYEVSLGDTKDGVKRQVSGVSIECRVSDVSGQVWCRLQTENH